MCGLWLPYWTAQIENMPITAGSSVGLCGFVALQSLGWNLLLVLWCPVPLLYGQWQFACSFYPRVQAHWGQDYVGCVLLPMPHSACLLCTNVDQWMAEQAVFVDPKLCFWDPGGLGEPIRAQSFCYTKIWKQPNCPLTAEWIKKIWNTYTMEYQS